MAKRWIRVSPSKRYNFRPNAAYRSGWDFLPRARAKIIARQLTYLDFHEWLMSNLSHSLNRDKDDWRPLFSTVAEGFYKTDVLLYASICEAALHSVLYKHYGRQDDGADQAVKDCFLRVEDRSRDFREVRGQKLSLGSPPDTITGCLSLHFTHEKPISDSDVKFVSLIKAGEAIGIYDSALQQRLDALREDRNTIHLAKHIERSTQHPEFRDADRTRAKKTTEDLRRELYRFDAAYLST